MGEPTRVEMGGPSTGRSTDNAKWPLDVSVEHAKHRMFLQEHLGELSDGDEEVASFGYSGAAIVIHCKRPHRAQYVIPLNDAIREVVRRHEAGELVTQDDYDGRPM